jgi:rhodanese-related sulfurtransferase
MDGEIDPATLEPELADGDAPLVVDIRQPGAFRRGHIPDSVNLPLSELVGDVERVAGADHVVTVCPHGKASVKAARLIASYEGFDGGLTAWDGPLEGGATDGAPTDVAAEADDPDPPF